MIVLPISLRPREPGCPEMTLSCYFLASSASTCSRACALPRRDHQRGIYDRIGWDDWQHYCQDDRDDWWSRSTGFRHYYPGHPTKLSSESFINCTLGQTWLRKNDRFLLKCELRKYMRQIFLPLVDVRVNVFQY